MELLGHRIRPSQNLYHYTIRNTDIYCILASSGMRNDRSPVNILVLCDAVLFCGEASTLWRNLQPLLSV